MDIRKLTPDFAVSPQIAPGDAATLAQAGFRMVICNRPDAEVDGDVAAATMKTAVEAAGLLWAENVIIGGAMTMENVTVQGALAAQSDGLVFAYCRSGTRSATAWALSQAGVISTDEIIAAAARGGYDLGHMAAQIEALAAQKG